MTGPTEWTPNPYSGGKAIFYTWLNKGFLYLVGSISKVVFKFSWNRIYFDKPSPSTSPFVPSLSLDSHMRRIILKLARWIHLASRMKNAVTSVSAMFREGKYMVIYFTPKMHKTLIRNSKEQLRSTVGAEGPNYAMAPLGCRPRRG